MSDYQRKRDKDKKMSTVKEKSMPLRFPNKRPDKQLYVPRALRKSDIENETDKEAMSKVNKPSATFLQATCNKVPEIQKPENESSLSIQESNNFKDTKISNSNVDDILKVEQCNVLLTETLKDPNQERTVDCVTEEISNQALNDHEQCMKDVNESNDITKIDSHIKEPEKLNEKTSKDQIDLENADKSEKNIKNNEALIQNSNENLCNPIVVAQVNMEDSSSTENAEDSWETMFNDDGDCLDPSFIKELCDITGQIEVTVAKNDYSSYQPVSRNSAEEFEHIVELYGFPVEFSTQDLTSAFSSFQEASYNIKWVDDCHALVIFSSPAIASQALHLSHPLIKVRPVSEGIKESKEKARFCARMFEARKPRPVTSAVLARRLVSGALGLKVNASKEQRDIERNMLKEAKEKKKLKARQRQDIWNGIVS